MSNGTVLVGEDLSSKQLYYLEDIVLEASMTSLIN